MDGGTVDADFQDAGSSDGTAVGSEELQVPSGADEAGLEDASPVGRSLELDGRGLGADHRMAGDADLVTPEAFDQVMAVSGLDIEQRAGLQALAIDVFSGRHLRSLLSHYYAISPD